MMRANPFADLVTMYRLVIIEGSMPALEQFSRFFWEALLSFILGYFWFMRTKKGFADVL